MDSRFLTTGQVAEHCGVNFRTVIRWIQRGYLNAQRLPGRGDHRIERREFLSFLKEHDMKVPDELSELAGTKPLDLENKRVLIVDDEPGFSRSIERLLLRNGYETKISPDGFSAGLVISTFQPALVVLDLKMPHMDGFEVLRVLKETGFDRRLQVLVVSSDTDERLADSIKAGAADYLKKPFENRELLEKLERLLGDSTREDSRSSK